MAPTNPSDPPAIEGSLFPATEKGFLLFLVEANRMQVDGYELFTVVRLQSHLAAIYKRAIPKNPRPGGTFFEEM